MGLVFNVLARRRRLVMSPYEIVYIDDTIMERNIER